MSKTPATTDREQRLAAKLRENLKRRKQQARARSGAAEADGDTKGQGDRAALNDGGDSDS